MRGFKIQEGITTRETDSFKAYLRDVSTIEMFSSSDAELECAYRASEGDEAAIDELVRRNLRFVISVAKQYVNSDVSLEDLVNQGNLGLFEAATRFDPTSGNKFISYAVWYIRKEIMYFLTKHGRQIRIPSNRVTSMHKFGNAIVRLEQTLGRRVELVDLKADDYLNEHFTTDEIELMFNIKNMSVNSMDGNIGSDGDSVTYHDLLESSFFKPTDHLISESSSTTLINDLLSCLDDREKKVVELYHGIGCETSMKLNEISEIYGITREGIRQIRDKAIKKVRNQARLRGIKQFNF
jgi:RNA polymerase primary sigma factor